MTHPRLCEDCGTALSPGARFCSGCGQPVKAPPAVGPGPVAASAADDAPVAPPAPTPVPTQPQGERVLGVIAGVQRKKGLFGFQTFNVIVTPQRIVFAEMTGAMQKEAVKQAAEQAKREGKRFFGQWGAQFGWLQTVVDRYAAMSPEQALRENAANFALTPAQVRRVRVHREVHRDDDNSRVATDHLAIEATTGKYAFKLTAGNPDEARNLLREVFGGSVQ